MTNPTKAELNEAVARHEGWDSFMWSDGVTRWRSGGERMAGEGHRHHDPPDYLADTPQSRDVAFRLLVEMARTRRWSVWFDPEDDGWNVLSAGFVCGDDPESVLLAIYRAADAAGLLGE